MTKTLFRGAGVGICLVAGLACVWAQQPGGPQKPFKILTFRLQDNRLKPAQLTVPEGRYVVNLINGFVLADLDFTWKDDKNVAKGSSRVPKGSGKSRMFVSLTPGKHVLQATGKPEWKCDITVIKSN